MQDEVMTREEAKRRMECCRNFLANNYPDMGEPNITAFNMAIKALEQKSYKDCISREWIKTAIHNFYYGLTHTPTEEDIQAYLDAAPSVQPQAEQEPCEDCINREQAKEEIRKAFPQLKDRVEINSILNGLPSVQPKAEQEDCISRKQVIRLFEQRFIELQKVHQQDKQLGVNWCINTIKDMPSVKPKVGHWLYNNGSYKCEFCGHEITGREEDLNYCCKCGAKLESEG